MTTRSLTRNKLVHKGSITSKYGFHGSDPSTHRIPLCINLVWVARFEHAYRDPKSRGQPLSHTQTTLFFGPAKNAVRFFTQQTIIPRMDMKMLNFSHPFENIHRPLIPFPLRQSFKAAGALHLEVKFLFKIIDPLSIDVINRPANL